MTEYLFNVFLIVLSFAVFGFIHSFLASTKVKRFLLKTNQKLIPFYRIFYNVFTIFILFVIYINLPPPEITIYDLPKPFDFIILVFQFFSLIGILWTLRFFSVTEFLGIAQIERLSKNQYNFNELDEKSTLKIMGPYKWVRHPLYLFSILFLIFRPYMDLYYLTMIFCIISYFYIGSIYEEKKLLEKFGAEYKTYQKAVPRIFPIKLFHPRNS